MSGSSAASWSDNPYAPKVSHRTHLSEHGEFGASPIYAVSYGIIIVLFFQCMSALFSPVGRGQRGTRWLLVIHTVAMFSFATISTALDLYKQSLCFIDDRAFTGTNVLPPGPLGYLRSITPTALIIVMAAPMVLNGLLADGLLLYRCYIFCGMDYRVIAFPSIVYFVSFVMGIMYLFQMSHPYGTYWVSIVPFGVIYLSISASLTFLLTMMIVIRLALHNRSVRNAIGASVEISGIPHVISVMLIESCGLYTICSIAYIVPWSLESYISDYFYPVINAAQVIAPFLITLRVANRTALTSDTISGSTGGTSTVRFRRTEESTDHYGMATSDGNLAKPGGGYGGTSEGQASAATGDTIQEALISQDPKVSLKA